jgi:hypothetical protein
MTNGTGTGIRTPVPYRNNATREKEVLSLITALRVRLRVSVATTESTQ